MNGLNVALEEPQLPNLLREQIDYSKYTFLFQAEPDACDDCRAFHHMELTLEDIEFLFGEYLEKNEYVWHPNVHPHCRCVLILYRVIEEMILETVAIVEMATTTHHAPLFTSETYKGGEKPRWDSNLN
ncbi:hypothetical protein GWO13_06380 [Candidatus Bathyarchaeota archaeon]|nr:hypothetical protein [Candidatus Bathyarchaeota archaeon]